MHKKSNQNIFLYRNKTNVRGINNDEFEQHMKTIIKYKCYFSNNVKTTFLSHIIYEKIKYFEGA